MRVKNSGLRQGECPRALQGAITGEQSARDKTNVSSQRGLVEDAQTAL